MTPSLALLVLSTLPAAPALGPLQFDSVAELRAALRAGPSSRRLDAVHFLRDGRWPRAAEPDAAERHQVTTDLLRLLGDPVADVRAAALDVLCGWQDAGQLTVTGRKAFVRALDPLVADAAHPQRIRLARRLAKLDPQRVPAATRALREALAGTTAEADRVEAAVGLGELSPADRPAAAEVCREAAARGTGMTALSAASALRKWKEIDAPEWSRLVAAAMERSPDPIDRGNLATALAVVRPPAKEAVPALLRVMNGTGPYARAMAADAVLDLDPARGPEVVPVARELLKDPENRGTAARVIGRIGSPAKDALPDLRAALRACPPRDDPLRVIERVNLLAAIGQVDPAGVPEAVAGLRDYVRGPSDWGRTMAVGAIGSLGPAAGEALPDVVRLGRTTPSTVERMGVARVLGEIGRGSREAEALLREWAADADPFLRPAAEAALKKLTARPVPK